MDPLTALGLAANIYTFIEVGFKVVRQFNEIRRNGLVTTHENLQIRKVTDELRKFYDKLAADGPESLQNLAVWCKALCEELIDLLDQLVLKGTSSKRKSLKLVLKSILKESRISSLQAKLTSYRGQLVANLLLTLSEKQSELNRKLDSIQNDIRRLSELRFNEFAQLRSDLLGAVKSCSRNTSPDNSIHEQLSRLHATLVSARSEIPILMQLRFEAMFDREDGIKDATDGTFSWPYDDCWAKGSTHQQLKRETQFTPWLRSGCGIFHISGKAGSGKSTLMKKICLEPQTEKHLKHWAGDRELLAAAFFFWNLGNDNQKSLTGLCRSVLFSVLNQRPSLIPEVFPLFWNGNQPISPTDLAELTRPPTIKKAFQTLMDKAMTGDYCLCLFIDGLDEYEADSEDYWDLAKQLRNWTFHSRGNIKICVSSRPYDEFLQTFKPSEDMDHHQVHLHELNKSDIEMHCRIKFMKDEDFDKLEALRESCHYLVAEIVDRSEGVFLWAVLVTRIILSEARRHGTSDDLKRKLDELPRDMDRLYSRILGSLSPADRKITNRILFVVLTNPFHWHVNILGLESLIRRNKIQSDLNTNYTMYDAEKHIHYVKNHLDEWTRGLIETSTYRDFELHNYPSLVQPLLETGVKFLHRSLGEYLVQPDRLVELQESCPRVSLADLHACIRLRELEYIAKIDSFDVGNRYSRQSTFNYGYEITEMKFRISITEGEKYESHEVSGPLLQKLIQIFPSSSALSVFHSFTFMNIWETEPMDQTSQLCFAAYLGHNSGVMKAIQLWTDVPVKTGPSRRSLLLSASFSGILDYDHSTWKKIPNEELIIFLLRRGFSAHQRILFCDQPILKPLDFETEVDVSAEPSVWIIMISYLFSINKTGVKWRGKLVCEDALQKQKLAKVVNVMGVILRHEPQEEVLILCSWKQRADSFMTLEDLVRICIPNEQAPIFDELRNWPNYESGSRFSDYTPTWLWDVASCIGNDAMPDNLTKLTADIIKGTWDILLYAVVSKTTFFAMGDHRDPCVFLW
ncbi:hypothetical protein F4806DRAFT_476715 [Annulohypoxylon nitens]|nr:hypothetical protein F4806DRAFT_476715 [Annulohypoxylon nitens]